MSQKTTGLHGLASALLLILGVVPAVVAGCGDDSETEPIQSSVASTGSGAGGGPQEEYCLLHNCEVDAHCGACSDGRNRCLVAEKRCVACDPVSGEGCPDGLECSDYGNCIPPGLTCPTEGGTPTITCSISADCAACDPAHLICDAATQQCVQCVDGDTTQCGTNEICVANLCSPKCPDTCHTDNDCAQCGTFANEPGT